MFEVDINLCNVKLPKLTKKRKKLPELETIIRLFQGSNVELPVLLATWLSLRIGEVLGLQFRDVDETAGTIYIRRTVITTNNGTQIREGCKTEKSSRVLRVPEYILDLIRKIEHEKETDPIVPFASNTVRSRFKKIVHKNGIDMTFHDLRHLNASIMLMLGVPDKYAMERGGWATDNILKSVYQDTFDSERIKVDDKIDDYFNSVICRTKMLNKGVISVEQSKSTVATTA